MKHRLKRELKYRSEQRNKVIWKHRIRNIVYNIWEHVYTSYHYEVTNHARAEDMINSSQTGSL